MCTCAEDRVASQSAHPDFTVRQWLHRQGTCPRPRGGLTVGGIGTWVLLHTVRAFPDVALALQPARKNPQACEGLFHSLSPSWILGVQQPQACAWPSPPRQPRQLPRARLSPDLHGSKCVSAWPSLTGTTAVSDALVMDVSDTQGGHWIQDYLVRKRGKAPLHFQSFLYRFNLMLVCL